MSAGSWTEQHDAPRGFGTITLRWPVGLVERLLVDLEQRGATKKERAFFRVRGREGLEVFLRQPVDMMRLQ